MHKAFVVALGASLLVGTASAQIQQPSLPPGAQRPELRTSGCTGAVDLAINRVTLRKTPSPGVAEIAFDVWNLGPGDWASGEGQQRVGLVLRDAGGARTIVDQPIAVGRFAARGSAGRVTSTIRFESFDTSELEAFISWEPDLRTDGNPCNDDRWPSNDRMRITPIQLREFFWGPGERTFAR